MGEWHLSGHTRPLKKIVKNRTEGLIPAMAHSLFEIMNMMTKRIGLGVLVAEECQRGLECPPDRRQPHLMFFYPYPDERTYVQERKEAVRG